MNKWYRSAPCKGILVILEHIFAVVMVICLVWLMMYPAGGIEDAITEKPKEKYEDSKGFETTLQGIASSVIWAEPMRENFEMDGEYNANKIVDLKEYIDNQVISGENKNGLAYRIGDLVEWGHKINDSEIAEYDRNIIVCKSPDDTYHYYYEEEFRELVNGGMLVFSNAEQARSDYGIENTEEYVDSLIGDWGSSSIYQSILDADSKLVYTSCWKYDGFYLNELYAPSDAQNILDIVNNNEYWNGKLNEAMGDLSYAVGQIYNYQSEYRNIIDEWSEGNSNVSYILVDLDRSKVYTNHAEYAAFDKWKENVEVLKKQGKYVVVTPKLAEFSSNLDAASAGEWKSLAKEGGSAKNYVYAFQVDTRYPVQDSFYQDGQVYVKYAPVIRSIFVWMIVAGLAGLIILVWLTIVAGRSNKEENLRLMLIDRGYTEIFLAVFAGGAAVCFYLLQWILDIVYGTYYEVTIDTPVASSAYMTASNMTMGMEQMAAIGCVMVIICAITLLFYLALVRRIKARTLWKNSILKKLIEAVGLGISHMSVIWKAVLGFLIFLILHWMVAITGGNSLIIFVTLLAEVAAFIYLVRSAIGKDEIKKGAVKIAGGEVNYQIPLKNLKGEQLQVARHINMIGDGLDKALDESMKNERLKTDLITNVSHDIKTPLTSIINYVDLLKRENFQDPKIQNYLKVLEEKAQRLKTLTEDVVEASKLSSGNVKLEMMNLNLVELVNQTSAELEEKFEARNLNLIMQMPNEPIVIYADGRKMWRVFANIFNNAAKYAMEHSRVYAGLYQSEQEVLFTLKNVSEQSLNISAEELTERFIRGDVSRSTEGSGLGLSIAKNLVELQGGTFELYLDGDLFKVIITFPRARLGEKVTEIPEEE